MAESRLDKRIADSGRYSRAEAKALIRAGRVLLDGRPAKAGEQKCGEQAVILIDGERLDCRRLRYYMMNKPAGLLSATEDRDQSTVLDLLPAELRRMELAPVGRLDKDTTGLLLLSNDGDFAHRVISPRQHVPKRYRAVLDTPFSPEDVHRFQEGIVLSDGTVCLPAELRRGDSESEAIVTVFEGKYHQVKRMFAAVGKKVLTLHRLSVGALELDPALPAGSFRELTEAELDLVFAPSAR